MALTDESNGMGTTMLVQPTGMGGGFGDGFGGGNGLYWILLLFILLGFGNGWNNGGNNGGGYGGTGALYPWMNQAEITTGGFHDQMINSTLGDISGAVNNGFSNVQQALCNGFAGVNATVNGGFASAEASANARQMANMNQAFGAQTAMMQGFNNIQSQFADCCCEQRLASCQTQNIIQNEGNATRFADANNTRDIIQSQTQGTQAILDKLCQLELDGVKGQLAAAQRENVGLQNQLNMATMRESQTAQNAFIQQGFSNEIDALYNRLSNCPVPSVPVYGRQPIFTCGGANTGCGCGVA